MRTTYSSPTRMRPSSPFTLMNRANSVGRDVVGVGAHARHQIGGRQLRPADAHRVPAVEQRSDPVLRELQLAGDVVGRGTVVVGEACSFLPVQRRRPPEVVPDGQRDPERPEGCRDDASGDGDRRGTETPFPDRGSRPPFTGTDPWRDTTRVIRRADAHDAIGELKQQQGEDILIFGSHTLWNRLLAEGLVDELHLMIGAVILGDGVRAFEVPAATSLRLLEARALEGSQNLLARYAVNGSRPV